ncbi:YwqJ-related putative deaminase [Amycolatopsis sp. NBC_00345]|uniref:YwqJ-related putative deaminase n=1 Tax=Amycolatopsis sp. NBC_00345 TaxID=2975955 RepID=UPI002E257D36
MSQPHDFAAQLTAYLVAATENREKNRTVPDEPADDQGPAKRRKKNKEVQWNDAVKDNETLPVGQKGKYDRPRPANPATPVLTGEGTQHQKNPARGDAHPLKAFSATPWEDDHLADHALDSTSHALADQVKDRSNNTRPGMAGALVAGARISDHTSMKQGDPHVHPLVSSILSDIGEKEDNVNKPNRDQNNNEYPMGNGHGRCAEVGVISDYLWEVDPDNSWSLSDARNHFEHLGAATAANLTAPKVATPAKPVALPPIPPCDSCSYLTYKLCIPTLSPQTESTGADTPPALKNYSWDKRH